MKKSCTKNDADSRKSKWSIASIWENEVRKAELAVRNLTNCAAVMRIPLTRHLGIHRIIKGLFWIFHKGVSDA